ncbi:MAG: molybdate ABC transporter substrate-binding protein [Dehalococcoidales bacterium]|nr:molybdate ABC transporter substrate-binding protein [Dehalococcoidales bacterium]
MTIPSKVNYRLTSLLLIAAAVFTVLPSGCSGRDNSTGASPEEVNLTVSAAASLTDVLKEINQLYTQNETNVTISTNFASSGTLQTQIENGAPVDIFISASPIQMDNLQKKDLLLNETRINLLSNKVVVVVSADSALGISSFSDLAWDKVKKIAVGDPKSVPAGTYALEAFDRLGITAQIQPKEVLAGDVRQVLTYVESNNVDAGIVYATDALTSTKVKIVASAPANINAKIVYPAAVIKTGKNPGAARAYLNFLSGPQAKIVFEKYGFTVIAK